MEQREGLCRKADVPSVEILTEMAVKWHLENIGPLTQRTHGDRLVYDVRVREALVAADAGAPPGPSAEQILMPL